MTDIAQLEILEGRAEAAAPVVLPPIEQELADMLDLVAIQCEDCAFQGFTRGHTSNKEF